MNPLSNLVLHQISQCVQKVQSVWIELVIAVAVCLNKH